MTLAELRKKNKIRQVDLAEKLGITRQYLCEIENGKHQPSMNVIYGISKNLKITLSQAIKLFEKEK